MAGKGEAKTSKRRVVGAQRAAEALKMRTAGSTFEEIAEGLGYADKSGAYRAVVAGLQATLKEPAEELRALESKRLDTLQKSIWERALAGDVKALDAVLRIAVRRARLVGLDAPIRTAVEHTGSLEQRIREWHGDDPQPSD